MQSREFVAYAADRAEQLLRSTREPGKTVSLSFVGDVAVVGHVPINQLVGAKTPLNAEIITPADAATGLSAVSEYALTREMPDGAIPDTLAGIGHMPIPPANG